MATTTPRDLDWEELEEMGTGDLINVMLANFDPSAIRDDSIAPYRQNGTYHSAVEILNTRLPGGLPE